MVEEKIRKRTLQTLLYVTSRAVKTDSRISNMSFHNRTYVSSFIKAEVKYVLIT